MGRSGKRPTDRPLDRVLGCGSLLVPTIARAVRVAGSGSNGLLVSQRYGESAMSAVMSGQVRIGFG